LFRLAKGQREFSLVLLACVVEAEAAQPVAPAAPTSPFAPASAGPSPAGQPGPTAALPVEAAPAAPFSAGPPLLAGAPAAPPASTEQQELAAMAPPSGYSQPRVRLKGQEAEVRYLRTTGIARSLPAVPPIAIVAALVLIVVGLIAWFVIPNALEESQTDRFVSLIEETRHAITDANGAQDPAQKRELLRLADTKLLEAAGLRADAPEVAELRSQIDAAVAELNAVVELPELELIADLAEQVPGAVSPKDLALGGGGAYLLDREQSRVIAIALVGASAEPFVLFQSGDLVGTEVSGLPQQIAWAEELNALLIMDDARRLIVVAPAGESAQLLTVRDAQAWGSANGIAYASGSLYLLDRAADQVWRYLPSDSGFDSEREPLVSSLDLEQVVEFAAGDALYLVMGDNSIVRVQNRQPQPFPQAGIDVPLASPASVVPLPELGRVLVADRGNNRIAVFSADGTFLEQWRSSSFTDLRAIAVDERGGLLYILVGGALYRTPLPPP
ncbi:MAG: hypothetical protein HY723_03370, partial [Chloroflexi bacterium]|nr:hypothetical protein [Chloroflexota bacterium]